MHPIERQELIDYLRTVPVFKQTWNYSGVRGFLNDNTINPDQRFTLLQLLELVEGKASGGS